ncbi:MAG: hypothetical protein AB1656_16165 [Candidatus Omnitrophota bacterium]
MPSYSIKILAACSLILLFTGAALFVGLRQPGEAYFERLLDDIASKSEIGGALAEAEDCADFLASGLGAEPGGEELRPAADAHFRIAGTLLARNGAQFQEKAKAHLEEAIRLYPAVRHGWPQFQLGELLESRLRGRDPASATAAIEKYASVWEYDSGELALKAGYKICLLKTRHSIPWEASDGLTLYHYLRFASENILDDVRPFPISVFQGEAAGFLKGLSACAAGDKNAAADFLCEYSKKNPKDYCAAYFLHFVGGTAFNKLYPEDGDLLTSFYAPRSFRDGRLLLLHDGRIRADAYVPQAAQEGKILLHLNIKNPLRRPFRLLMKWNSETKSLDVAADRKEGNFDIPFETAPQLRNLIDIHLFMDELDSLPSGETPLISIGELRLILQKPEPAL